MCGVFFAGVRWGAFAAGGIAAAALLAQIAAERA
jgi:hypothetical protein